MRIVLKVGLWVVLVGAAWGQVPVTGGAGGTSLADIVGTSTQVTVILKARGAEIPNLRIQSVEQDHFAVLDSSGAQKFYIHEDVKELRIQDGTVRVKERTKPVSHLLSADDKAIVDGAFRRVKEIYNRSANQILKMQAAVLLALHKEGDFRVGHDYLRQLSESNDLETTLRAAEALYLIDDKSYLEGTLLTDGIRDGSPALRARAMTLLGLSQDKSLVYVLKEKIRKRQAEQSAPAARALGMLGERSVEPQLLKMIMENNAARAEAAVFALSAIGDADTASKLVEILGDDRGEALFRVARVLYALDASVGLPLLRDKCMNVATLEPMAATVLAADSDDLAMQALRDRLARPYDATATSLTFRARAAAALVEGGDLDAPTVLHNILRMSPSDMQSGMQSDMKGKSKGEALRDVKIYVCQHIGRMGKRKLLSLVQANIESHDPALALAACEAAIAIAQPDFGARLSKVRVETPWSAAFTF